LRRFPFYVLKIDRSFIAGIPENQEDAELTRAIIAMAQALGLTGQSHQRIKIYF
jgi:EAL domain-containing protein (putative c-di-GMP-specific phosphodiesterase class I)